MTSIRSKLTMLLSPSVRPRGKHLKILIKNFSRLTKMAAQPPNVFTLGGHWNELLPWCGLRFRY